MKVQLVHQPGAMAFRRLRAYVQERSNLFCGVPLGNKLKDLALARRKGIRYWFSGRDVRLQQWTKKPATDIQFAAHHASHGLVDLFQAVGFVEKAVDPKANRFCHDIFIGPKSQYKNFGVWLRLQDLPRDIQPIHLGHIDVQ